MSLLSCFNKIMEKILAKRLIGFFTDNKILFDFKYGFIKLYSTTLALIEFPDNIMKYLDQGNYGISIFVDMTKAFDTVDNNILLEKMNKYGIRGHANNFFRSYLENRCKYIVIKGTTSTIENIRCGVPRGPVLGPLFFAIYINDLYKSVGRDYIRLFADDTALAMHGGDLSLLVEQIRQSFKIFTDGVFVIH